MKGRSLLNSLRIYARSITAFDPYFNVRMKRPFQGDLPSIRYSGGVMQVEPVQSCRERVTKKVLRQVLTRLAIISITIEISKLHI